MNLFEESYKMWPNVYSSTEGKKQRSGDKKLKLFPV